MLHPRDTDAFSQRVRLEDGACSRGLLGFLDLVHPRGASLHAHVVEEFGTTLERGCHLSENRGQDKSSVSVCVKERHEAPLALLKSGFITVLELYWNIHSQAHL